MKKSSNALKLLNKLNAEYSRLLSEFEKHFWISYMGDHSVDAKMNAAQKTRDAFEASRTLANEVQEAMTGASAKEKIRLGYWQKFFQKYQLPDKALRIKEKVDALESRLMAKKSHAKEGYIDPYAKKFVVASHLKMRQMVRTHDDERMRRACFEAIEAKSLKDVPTYVRLVGLRNEFARALGYKDFYAFKTMSEEGMRSGEVFKIFDKIYQRTKYAYADLRKIEREKMKGLRKPWNFSYMMAGDFTKEQDQYFQFEEALIRWGRSFAAIGIDFQGATLQLDLLDRKGKYPNGFCHYPQSVRFKDGRRLSGAANFTTTVVPGQVGSGAIGMNTLFHEGGHAADRNNSQMEDVCLNTEYPPASTAWAETHSMFLDTMFSSVEWRTRYARNGAGQAYPFDLAERMARKLAPLAPLEMSGILFVVDFERRIYAEQALTEKKVLALAKAASRKYLDYDRDTYSILSIPHIFSWQSACSYHGYGLAELSLAQWREYFYAKYGYIVDNPKVGKEMTRVWKLGSSHTFAEFVKLATGKDLSPESFIRAATRGTSAKISLAKRRLERMRKVPEYRGKVRLNATIQMVHGKRLVADSRQGFEKMARKYGLFLARMARRTV